LLEPSNAEVFRMGTSPTDQVIPALASRNGALLA
jgi:hypothetical protein